MPTFFGFIIKLLPFYCFILMGYISAKKLKIERSPIASLILYIINPLIIILNLLTLDLTIQIAIFPIIIFCLCALMSTFFRLLGKKIYSQEPLQSILAFTAGTGNTGYFGLGMILAFLGKESFSIAIVGVLGFIFYDNSLGYYIASSGKHSLKDGIIRVLKLPTFQAFVLGTILNIAGLRIAGPFLDMLDYAKGAYMLLGMMLIGISLKGIKKHHIDWGFMSLCLLAKFLMWPLIVQIFIITDQNFLGILTAQMHEILQLLSIVPMAVNTIVFASELNIHPEKASLAVLVSTLLCLLYIPAFLIFLT